MQIDPSRAADFIDSLPDPANNDGPPVVAPLGLDISKTGRDQKILEWLFRMTAKPVSPAQSSVVSSADAALSGSDDDWMVVANICGYGKDDFASAGSSLPLTSAEIDHFRRNHRDTEGWACRAFAASGSDLPAPLSELYGLYRYRARMDIESAFFVAQATGSTRVAAIVADLLAIGGFACGHEYINHATLTYSVPAAFDTSMLIDLANREAALRMALPSEHPSNLLALSPDEIGVLSAEIVEEYAMSGAAFIDKSNLLSEARQDVNRLPRNGQFAVALEQGDLPRRSPWVVRICAAYARLLPSWVTSEEIFAVTNSDEPAA